MQAGYHDYLPNDIPPNDNFPRATHVGKGAMSSFGSGSIPSPSFSASCH
jgi:hypothetical protein